MNAKRSNGRNSSRISKIDVQGKLPSKHVPAPANSNAAKTLRRQSSRNIKHSVLDQDVDACVDISDYSQTSNKDSHITKDYATQKIANKGISNYQKNGCNSKTSKAKWNILGGSNKASSNISIENAQKIEFFKKKESDTTFTSIEIELDEQASSESDTSTSESDSEPHFGKRDMPLRNSRGTRYYNLLDIVRSGGTLSNNFADSLLYGSRMWDESESDHDWDPYDIYGANANHLLKCKESEPESESEEEDADSGSDSETVENETSNSSEYSSSNDSVTKSSKEQCDGVKTRKMPNKPCIESKNFNKRNNLVECKGNSKTN